MPVIKGFALIEAATEEDKEKYVNFWSEWGLTITETVPIEEVFKYGAALLKEEKRPEVRATLEKMERHRPPAPPGSIQEWAEQRTWLVNWEFNYPEELDRVVDGWIEYKRLQGEGLLPKNSNWKRT